MRGVGRGGAGTGGAGKVGNGLFLTWIIIGAAAGWLGSIIMHTERQGCIMNTVIGVIGGFVGGLIVGLLGGTGVNGFNLWSLFVALIGSVVLLWIAKKAGRPKG